MGAPPEPGMLGMELGRHQELSEEPPAALGSFGRTFCVSGMSPSTSAGKAAKNHRIWAEMSLQGRCHSAEQGQPAGGFGNLASNIWEPFLSDPVLSAALDRI